MWHVADWEGNTMANKAGSRKQIRQGAQDREQKAHQPMGHGKAMGMTLGEGASLIYGMPNKNVGPHCCS